MKLDRVLQANRKHISSSTLPRREEGPTNKIQINVLALHLILFNAVPCFLSSISSADSFSLFLSSPVPLFHNHDEKRALKIFWRDRQVLADHRETASEGKGRHRKRENKKWRSLLKPSKERFLFLCKRIFRAILKLITWSHSSARVHAALRKTCFYIHFHRGFSQQARLLKCSASFSRRWWVQTKEETKTQPRKWVAREQC